MLLTAQQNILLCDEQFGRWELEAQASSRLWALMNSIIFINEVAGQSKWNVLFLCATRSIQKANIIHLLFYWRQQQQIDLEQQEIRYKLMDWLWGSLYKLIDFADFVMLNGEKVDRLLLFGSENGHLPVLVPIFLT